MTPISTMFSKFIISWTVLISIALSNGQVSDQSISPGIRTFGRFIRSTRVKRDSCVRGLLYCGHQKPWMRTLKDGNDRPMSHYLYKCSPISGDYLWLEKKCSYGCSATNSVSSCDPECTAGLKYCGYELKTLGFSSFSHDTLYRCDSNGRGVTYVKTCNAQKCIEKRDSMCSESCIIGRRYCHEKLLQINGWGHHKLESNTIWNCTNGTSAVRLEVCRGSCVDGEPSPYCLQKCSLGVLYCGSELQKLEGWSGGNANDLYRCTNSSGSELVRKCKGNCIESRKDSFCSQRCQPGRFYCGNELAKMEGWSGPWTSRDLQTIYLCTNGTNANLARTCGTECLAGDAVRCAPSCIDTRAYCGHELAKLEFTNVDANSLYKCVGNTTIEMVKKCATKCHHVGPNSNCVDGCVEGAIYCGSELVQMGFKMAFNLDDNYVAITRSALYVCHNKPNFPKAHSRCHDGCIPSTERVRAYCHKECAVGSTYCGHQLEKYGWTDKNPNDLFLCQLRQGPQKLRSCLNKCSTSGRSHCTQECDPGDLYCGHELHELGFVGGVPNTLYRCSNGTTVDFHGSCDGECEVVRQGNSRCLDMPLVLRDCGVQDPEDKMTPSIAGGNDSTSGRWPWMVSIRTQHHFCGGTLIDNQWVLTAAHCFDGSQTGRVVLGDYKRWDNNDRGQMTIKIGKVIKHPSYTVTSISHDIALLRLSTPVKYTNFIRRVCLPGIDSTLPEGTQCVVIGWGRIRGYLLTNVLQQGNIVILSNDTCKPLYGWYGPINERRHYQYDGNNMICAGKTNEDLTKVLTCGGDSGGPLLCRQGSAWTLQGVTSYGDTTACHMSTTSKSAVFTRVRSYLTWIGEEMDKPAEMQTHQLGTLEHDYEDE